MSVDAVAKSPAQPEPPMPIRWSGPQGIALQLAVALGLGAWHCIALARQLDFGSFDDLVRTVLSRAWSERPYLLTPDLYWMPVPAIARGAVLYAIERFVAVGPEAGVFLFRLVSMAYLWGAWRLLAGAIQKLGGGWVAILAFTIGMAINFGTFEFSAASLSEPDALFWTALAFRLLVSMDSARAREMMRVLGLGAALAVLCLTRYEAWPLAALIAVALPFLYRGQGVGFARWSGMLLPMGAIGAWLMASWAIHGSPFAFVAHGTRYVDALDMGNFAPRFAKSFLKLQAAFIPISFALAPGQVWRMRREAEGRWLGAILLILAAWTLFKLWKIDLTWRYAWEFCIFLMLAGALAMERRHAGASRRVLASLLGLLALASLCSLGWGVTRQQPYIPADVREFARSVQRESREGLIYILDAYEPEVAADFQAFRCIMDMRRITTCDWIQACDGLDRAKIELYDIRFVVARHKPKEIALEDLPFAETKSGWRAWRIVR